MPSDIHVPVRRVLWTGGWDSSFRILQLLFETQDIVQPVYLVSPNRLSLRHELRAMNSISQRARSRNASIAARLLPTRLFEKERIPAAPDVSEAYRKSLEGGFIGPQYEYLARFVRAGWIDAPLELCIEGECRPHVRLRDMLVPTSQPQVYTLGPDAPASALVTLFAGMEFPLLHFSKGRVRDHAAQHGYLDILERSWFCHEPVGSAPCGTCPPCVQVMKAGLARRLPWRARMRYHVSVERRVRGWKRDHTPESAD